MKCANKDCNYEHGWNGEKMVKGDSGEFFKLPIKLERKEGWEPTEQRTVYGCPKCCTVFMGSHRG